MGHIEIGEGSTIDPTATLYATERLVIGEGAKIGAGCVIEGRDIQIGREFWMGPGAKIGGGSCFERQSSLVAGHFLHMGEGSFINTARSVTIGNEVGLGMGTKLFTHGAYLSALDGFPVSFGPIGIGDNVWLPGAVVLPNVLIGSNVVVGINSVVNDWLPGRCFAAGSPAKVIREQAYPGELTYEERLEFWEKFWNDYPDQPPPETMQPIDFLYLLRSDTVFDTHNKVIVGEVTDESERLRDVLRRYGVRFYCSPKNGYYEPWENPSGYGSGDAAAGCGS